jgi:hypothetical protein
MQQITVVLFHFRAVKWLNHGFLGRFGEAGHLKMQQNGSFCCMVMPNDHYISEKPSVFSVPSRKVKYKGRPKNTKLQDTVAALLIKRPFL